MSTPVKNISNTEITDLEITDLEKSLEIAQRALQQGLTIEFYQEFDKTCQIPLMQYILSNASVDIPQDLCQRCYDLTQKANAAIMQDLNAFNRYIEETTQTEDPCQLQKILISMNHLNITSRLRYFSGPEIETLTAECDAKMNEAKGKLRQRTEIANRASHSVAKSEQVATRGLSWLPSCTTASRNPSLLTPQSNTNNPLPPRRTTSARSSEHLPSREPLTTRASSISTSSVEAKRTKEFERCISRWMVDSRKRLSKSA